jgi:hypothetical protein
MTTSDEYYYYSDGSRQSKAYKTKQNASRKSVRGKRIYPSHPMHPDHDLWLQGNLPAYHDRHTPNYPMPPTAKETWHSWEIDQIVRQAQRRYQDLDESYERVRCGYVYQARQLNVHYVSKVGFSGDPDNRIKAANTFLQPHEEFVIVKAWPAKDKYAAEKHVHRFLRDKRIMSKELFRGRYETIRDLIEVAMMEYYDAETAQV